MHHGEHGRQGFGLGGEQKAQGKGKGQHERADGTPARLLASELANRHAGLACAV
jgi:hypothetical protein